MRRPFLSLALAALSLSCLAPLLAANAPAATTAPAAASAPTAAPTAVTTTAAPAAATATPGQVMIPAASAAGTAAAPSSTAMAPASATAVESVAAQPTATATTEPAAMAATAPATMAAPSSMAEPGSPDVPVRGMNMANVEHIFGTPDRKYDAVGKPPITRWDYPDYVVYFEYNMVLHTVMKNQPNS